MVGGALRIAAQVLSYLLHRESGLPCLRLRVVDHAFVPFRAFRAFPASSFTPGSSPLVKITPNRSRASRMRAAWYTVTGGSPSTLSARRTIAECTLARWASLVGGQPSSSRACRIWAPVIIGGETHAS